MASVLFVSFAPAHSSHTRRMQDAAASNCTIEVYKTGIDKTRQSLLMRMITLDYLRLFISLLRSNHAVWWLWGADACFVGSLAKLIRRNKLLIWDLSDISRLFLMHGHLSRILRMIEAILLRQADRLLLASPQFYSKHYAGKIDSNKVVVVENYLATDMRLDYVDPPSPLTPFKIAYAGIFRSTKVLQLIAAAAAQLGDQVEFNLYGYPDTQLDKTVIARCGSLSNVHIHGEFEHAELPRICQRNHILLGFLDPDADLNEQWLLPNRIYHAGAFQRPVVVNEGTYTAKIVLERKLGLLCAFSVSATVEMIRHLSEHGGRLYFEIQKQIPTSGEYFLQGHYARILDEIAG